MFTLETKNDRFTVPNLTDMLLNEAQIQWYKARCAERKAAGSSTLRLRMRRFC